MKECVKLALIQLDSSNNQRENLDIISSLVHTASSKADLIILPEHADGIDRIDSTFACEIDGDIPKFYSSIAKECGVFLHCGSFTEKVENKIYNTSMLFSPNGEVVAKYRKLHLFDVDLPDGTGCRESDTISSGDSMTVVDTPFCKIGLSICYDIRFPELYRAMALAGAELIIVSANFTSPTGKSHWETLLRARAIENGCYVAAVNQCGQKPLFEAYGNTMLINPWGEVLCRLKQEQGILYGEISSSEIDETRMKIPSLKNRRNDYTKLFNKIQKGE